MTDPKPRSFFCEIRAKKGVLLGGVKRTVSSRFETLRMASQFSLQTLKANREAGRHAELVAIHRSELEPEILESEVA